MINIIRKIYFFNISEYYFRNNLPDVLQLKKNKIDFINLIQANFQFNRSRPFHTFNINLKEDIEIIWKKINKDFRYQIKRAENKDKISETIIDNPSMRDIDMFIEFFNKFAEVRSLRKANKNKLSIFLKQKKLKIAYAHTLDDKFNILSGHCYIHDEKRIRLYHSASNVNVKIINKNLVGRSNKLLHWKVITKFKKSDFHIYDFGGVSHTKHFNGIDKFKSHFHGEMVTEFSGLIPLSNKAKFVFFILKFLN